jgi:RNA polymerase sigma-70 factor, ECF subfamily
LQLIKKLETCVTFPGFLLISVSAIIKVILEIVLMTNRTQDSKDLEALTRGDAAAFTRVYNRYRDRVYGFAYRMLGTQAAAEDITHEAFMVLIKHPERYSPKRSSILTFLCAVARNCILNHFRLRGKEVEDFFEEDDLQQIKNEYEPDPLSSLLDRELAAKVSESIALLPEFQREVIVLREFQELSYDDISIVTGADVNVVKARLFRARQNLAKHLAPYIVLKGEECHEMRRS